MATFRSSALLALLLAQGTAPTPDSLAVLRARAERDTLDAAAQLALGRAYLLRFDSHHRLATHGDSVWERRMLDTAEQALVRAATPGSGSESDSARMLRVRVWMDRARAAWEGGGLWQGSDSWGPMPSDLRLSPVLEELGENLLRACPPAGILLTATDADSYAAWYMRYVRGLGADRLVVPYAVWESDPVFRARAAADLKLGSRGAGPGWLGELAGKQTVCATTAFPRPPDPPPKSGGKRVQWKTRPLVWVAGPHVKGESVAPRDFVFAALTVSLEDHDAWGESALAIYDRAARSTPPLCDALATFGAARAAASCRR